MELSLHLKLITNTRCNKEQRRADQQRCGQATRTITARGADRGGERVRCGVNRKLNQKLKSIDAMHTVVLLFWKGDPQLKKKRVHELYVNFK